MDLKIGIFGEFWKVSVVNHPVAAGNVGNIRNKSVDCIRKIDLDAIEEKAKPKNTIDKFFGTRKKASPKKSTKKSVTKQIQVSEVYKSFNLNLLACS